MIDVPWFYFVFIVPMVCALVSVFMCDQISIKKGMLFIGCTVKPLYNKPVGGEGPDVTI